MAKSKSRIVVVDDEASARTAMAELLRDEGYEVRVASDAFKALAHLDGWNPDMVITDVQMPGMTGIELISKIREQHSSLGILTVTAFSSVEKAVEAMHLGADDYLTKPVNVDELLIVVERILAKQAIMHENDRLRSVLAIEGDEAGWVGHSRASRELIQLLRQVADSEASLLLLGEAGTGKELAAQAVHRWSARNERPFVTVRCAGFTEQALQRELFGHESGVSGATATRKGRFEEAQGGTLLLDEITEISMGTQVKLLRALQDAEISRLGSEESISVDVRVIAATTGDLQAEVEAGRFRQDLYYRLDVVSVRLPTLRERQEDVPLLAMHFLRRHCARNRKDIRGFNERVLQVLRRFAWPGNVRQLENAIERAVVLCDDLRIEPRHLPRELMGLKPPSEQMPSIPGSSMAELEKYAIIKTLEYVGGSTSRAAKMLGISARTIQYRLNEYREHEPSGVPAIAGKRSRD